MAFENLKQEDLVDRGAPYRVLKDGTWPGTVVECEEHAGQKMLMCKVTVVVGPSKENGADQGPVELTTYLPAESVSSTGKRMSLGRLASFLNACGVRMQANGGFDNVACVGKPVRVMSRWTKSQDPQYQDRAEALDFLPPAAGQKPVAQYLRPAEEDGTEQAPAEGGKSPF